MQNFRPGSNGDSVPEINYLQLKCDEGGWMRDGEDVCRGQDIKVLKEFFVVSTNLNFAWWEEILHEFKLLGTI